jgi:hypothetical protein
MRATNAHTCGRFPLGSQKSGLGQVLSIIAESGGLGALRPCAETSTNTHTFKHAPARLQTQELVQTSTKT